MALDRTTILKAGLDLLEQKGLEGLTMRHLAKAVGVQAPSLYWHYRDKPALMADMADAMLDQVGRGVDLADNYRIVLPKIFEQLRLALMARRDGAMVYAAVPMPGPNRMRLANSCATVLTVAGFDPQTITRTVNALFNYVLGQAIHDQASARRAALALALERPDHDHAGNLAFGINAIVNGMGAAHNEDPRYVAMVQALRARRQA